MKPCRQIQVMAELNSSTGLENKYKHFSFMGLNFSTTDNISWTRYPTGKKRMLQRSDMKTITR